jgi:hypothetical protein
MARYAPVYFLYTVACRRKVVLFLSLETIAANAETVCHVYRQRHQKKYLSARAANTYGEFCPFEKVNIS